MLLIDVRSPAEFASPDPAESPLPGALNLEFTRIAELATLRPDLQPATDDVVLYCRSGRRSAIARQQLLGLGYAKVRDWGDLESARRVWEVEEKERKEGGSEGKSGGEEFTDFTTREPEGVPLEKHLASSYQALVAGLERAAGEVA